MSRIELEIRSKDGDKLTTFHNSDNVNLFVGLSDTNFMNIELNANNVRKLRDSLSKWIGD